MIKLFNFLKANLLKNKKCNLHAQWHRLAPESQLWGFIWVECSCFYVYVRFLHHQNLNLVQGHLTVAAKCSFLGNSEIIASFFFFSRSLDVKQWDLSVLRILTTVVISPFIITAGFLSSPRSAAGCYTEKRALLTASQTLLSIKVEPLPPAVTGGRPILWQHSPDATGSLPSS